MNQRSLGYEGKSSPQGNRSLLLDLKKRPLLPFPFGSCKQLPAAVHGQKTDSQTSTLQNTPVLSAAILTKHNTADSTSRNKGKAGVPKVVSLRFPPSKEG